MKKMIIVFLITSTNICAQWVVQNIVPGQNFSSVHFVDSLHGWIAGDFGLIIKTTDGGKNWSSQNSGINSHLRKIRFADLQNGWAVGDSGRIIHTTDGGCIWDLQYNGGNHLLKNLSIVDDNNCWVSAKNILLCTSDGGKDWDTISLALYSNEQVTDIFFIDRVKGWYCTSLYTSMGSLGRIFNTSNGGQTWINQLTSLQMQSSLSVLNVEAGWCAGNWSLYNTTNGGISWAELGEPNDHYYSKVFFVDSTIGWIVDEEYVIRHSKILFSSDGGTSWIHQLSTAHSEIILDLSFIEKRIGWMILASTINPRGMLIHTKNGGGVFPSTPTLVFPIDNHSINNDTIKFIWRTTIPSITGYSLNISNDSTFSNQIVDTLITDTTVTFTNLEGNKKYYWRVKAKNQIGWGGYSDIGSFVTSITDIKDENERVTEFSLSQNYPNPFNPNTKISWQSPVGSHQTLKIYDVLGREVAKLVDEYRDASSYEIEFDGSQLASGVYYYQFRVGDYVETRKMQLLK